jgi:hypothetical protein
VISIRFAMVLAMTAPVRNGISATPLDPAHQHVDATAAASRTDQPLAPSENCGLAP